MSLDLNGECMKIFCFFAFLSTILAGFAAEPIHQVYIEPDFFWSQSHFQIEGKKEESYGKFYGVDFGYKFMLPGSVYLAFEGLYAMGRSYYYLVHDEKSFRLGSANITDKKLECNVGANYQFSKFTLISFLGIGEYYSRSPGYRYILDYIPIGYDLSYAFNNAFTLGLNAKMLRHFYVARKLNSAKLGWFVWSEKNWGCEVALPFSLHAGSKNKWETQIEPYFFMFDVSSSLYIWGTRFNVGYSF